MYSVIQIFLLVTMAATAASQCLQMHTIKGNKLIGHTFKRDAKSDLIRCFQTCKNLGSCQSINFNMKKSICEFNNRTREARPLHFIPMKEWVYFDNPYKIIRSNSAIIGSSKSLPGRSCKDIRDSAWGILLNNTEYWIDPTNTLTPFSVYCDMKTDGGGWTLIARTLVTLDNETIGTMIRKSDYRQISNYSINNLRVNVPSLVELRKDMGFSQIRYFCHKKSVGRTFHIITKKNTKGKNVVDYFTKDHLQQRDACESYFREADDNSFLASNCGNWGNDGKRNEIGKWGYFQHNGTFRIYNDPAYWNGTSEKYFVNFLPQHLSCDENRSNSVHLREGDVWEVYVR